MAGHDSFFDGRILAEISVGTEGMPESGVSGGGGGERGSRGRRGGSGNLGIAGGDGLGGGHSSGGTPFGGGRPPRDAGERGHDFAGPRPTAGGGMGRPVMIHLRFTNHGAAAVTLRISDFMSPLGNFAVRPEQLALAPGQSLETEPMTSQLGGAFAETDATLVLRLEGQAEKRTFRLKAVTPPQAEAVPAEQ